MFSRALRQSSRRVAAISASSRIASVSPSKPASIAPAFHPAIVFSSSVQIMMPLALPLSGLDARGGVALDALELFRRAEC
jgi:hypothetical protein